MSSEKSEAHGFVFLALGFIIAICNVSRLSLMGSFAVGIGWFVGTLLLFTFVWSSARVEAQGLKLDDRMDRWQRSTMQEKRLACIASAMLVEQGKTQLEIAVRASRICTCLEAFAEPDQTAPQRTRQQRERNKRESDATNASISVGDAAIMARQSG